MQFAFTYVSYIQSEWEKFCMEKLFASYNLNGYFSINKDELSRIDANAKRVGSKCCTIGPSDEPIRLDGF
jgi:hypothetical protein